MINLVLLKEWKDSLIYLSLYCMSRMKDRYYNFSRYRSIFSKIWYLIIIILINLYKRIIFKYIKVYVCVYDGYINLLYWKNIKVFF